MFDFQDAYGKQIKIGDTIAMAFSKSSSAEIRVGTVLEFVESKPNAYSSRTVHKMRVGWIRKGYSPVKSLIENAHSCVVLEHGYEL